MSRRLIFFLFTLAVALAGALLVRSALRSKDASIQALRQSTVYVVVAARALSPGETVDSAGLKMVAWPREQMPPGAFIDLAGVIGKVVRNSLSTNQPVVESALLEPNKTGGVLPLLIPAGMRAMSIAVDEVSDMAGFVLPHSRVDVLVSVVPRWRRRCRSRGDRGPEQDRLAEYRGVGGGPDSGGGTGPAPRRQGGDLAGDS